MISLAFAFNFLVSLGELISQNGKIRTEVMKEFGWKRVRAGKKNTMTINNWLRKPQEGLSSQSSVEE